MKTIAAFLTLTVVLALSSTPTFIAQNAPNQPAAGPDGVFELFGVVKKVDGPADDVIVELPNGEFPTIAVDAKYPQGTAITTGTSATVIIAIEGTNNGQPFQNSMISIRHTSDIKLDRMLVESDSDSVVTRLKVATGEVRLKVTDDRPDFTTDLKVATPNATASIRGTEVQSVGYSANFGTSIAVASGSIVADRANGTSAGVGAGGDVNDSVMNALESMSTKGQVVVPQGSTAFEVSAGQLVLGGAKRTGSDTNNPNTNPSGQTSGLSSDEFQENPNAFENGAFLPSHSGRSNRK